MHIISIPNFAIERGRVAIQHRELDPKRTAVIAIDFQRYFIELDQPMGSRYAVDALTNANRLHRAVRVSGGLVIVTQHWSTRKPAAIDADDPEIPLAPGRTAFELDPRLEITEHDVRIVKRQSSPLHPRAATGLLALLQERNMGTLIISGLVTNGCCETTARDAFQYGFNVLFASDATSAMTDQEHNAALLNLSLYYARVSTTDDIVAALS